MPAELLEREQSRIAKFGEVPHVGLQSRQVHHEPADVRLPGMTSARRNVQKGYAFKMVESPIGGLKLVASKDGLAGILWEKDHPRRVRLSEG